MQLLFIAQISDLWSAYSLFFQNLNLDKVSSTISLITKLSFHVFQHPQENWQLRSAVYNGIQEGTV